MNVDDDVDLTIVTSCSFFCPCFLPCLFVAKKRSTLIVSSATHKMKSKGNSVFFFLLQSEYGDLFKVTLAYEETTVNLTLKRETTNELSSSSSLESW